MGKIKTHYLKHEKREMGKDVVCWHKFIELSKGIYLLETWNRGNVHHKEYSQADFDKMRAGKFEWGF